MYPQLIWPLPLKGYKANLRNTGIHILYNHQNMLRKRWNPILRSDMMTGQIKIIPLTISLKIKWQNTYGNLRPRESISLKKRKDWGSIIHFCLFDKMVYRISTNITPPNSQITLISLQTADVSPHSSRTSMAMSEEKRLPFAGYTF